MHIAFLNPQGNFDATDRGWTEHPDFGGQLVYVKEISLALAALGHRVDILTRRMDDADWPEFASAEDRYPETDAVRILRFPCGPKGFVPKEELWPHLAEWTEHIREHYDDEGRPDALTGHYADGGLVAAILTRDWGLPMTFTSHSLGAQKLDKLLEQGQDFDALCRRFRFERRIPAERVSAGWAGRVITSTELERREQWGHRVYEGSIDPARDDRFRVVPPGVNLKLFGREETNETEEDVAARIERALDRDLPPKRRDLPVVVCSSRLDRKKNHLALVRAWAADSDLREKANLALVIQGSFDPLRDRERFSGEAREILDEIVEVMDSADLWPSTTAFDLRNQPELAAGYRFFARRYRGVFALTTVYEPFGLAPLEAMAAGLPAVVTKHGGPSESLIDEHGVYGVLVDPFDPKDIARGLRRLVESKEAWTTFRDAGIRRVRERYTWDRTAQGYLAALESAREQPAPDPPVIPAWFEDPETEEPPSVDWLRGRVFGEGGG